MSEFTDAIDALLAESAPPPPERPQPRRAPAQEGEAQPNEGFFAGSLRNSILGRAAVPNITRGVVGAINETADAASQLGRAAGTQRDLPEWLDPNKPGIGGTVGRGIVSFSRFVRGTGAIDAEGEFADLPTPARDAAMSGRITEGVAQTVTGFLAGSRVLKAAGATGGTLGGSRILYGAAAGAIGDFAAFDGNEERLSNLIESVPELRNPVTEFMASREEDPELVGRIRNILEGAVVGIPIDAFLGALRGSKAAKNGDRAGVERAHDEVVAALEQDVSSPVRAAGEPQVTRVSDTQASPEVRASSERTSSRNADGGPAPRAETPEVPEGVFRSREDADAFLRDIEANRADSGRLNIKPGEVDSRVLASHGEWTLDTFGSPENLDATLRAIVDRQPATARRADAELVAAAERGADELGQTPETMLAAGSRIAGITGDIDTAVLTMRTMWARLSRTVDSYVGRQLTQVSDEEFANIVTDIHNAMTFGNYMGQVKSAMGRGLRVFQLPDADTYAKILREGDPEGQLNGGVRGVPPLPRNRDEAQDWLELWGFTRDNPRARAQMLEGLNAAPEQWHYLRNSFANLFTANILSGVPSIMLNVAGPALIGGLRTIEKTTGGAIAALVERNPARRAELRRASQNAAHAYAATIGDVQQAFRFARMAAQQGRSILGGGGSVSDSSQQFGPITENLLRAAGQEPRVGGVYALGNLANLWPRAFARLNNGLDEFAKRLAYLGEVRVRAMTEGAEQGLSGDALQAFVSQRLAGSTDEVGHALDEEMLRAAERTTLTGTPGSEGSYVRRQAGLVNDLRRNTPEIRYLLPIFNVPANAIGETLRRVPALNLLFKETREELTGARGAVAQAEAYGRTLLGAGFLVAGLNMARQGIITGPGPENADDRKVWLQTHQPYSIRVGDKWVSYSRYDILGALIGIPATVYDASVNRRQDRGFEHLSFAGAAALAQYFRDRAALQTVSELFALGEPGSNSEAFFERLAGSVGGRLIVPNFVTQLGRNMSDSQARVRATPFDYVRDMIPGLSQGLDPMRNVLGEPIHKPQDSLLENIAPMTMVSAVEYEDDSVLYEISRLYEVTGYAAGVTGQGEISSGFFDARQTKLEDGRSLFDAIIRKRMDVEVDGLTLRQTLQDLFDSPEYNDAVDADSNNRETSDGLESRGYMVAQVFRSFNTAAKQAVAEESPRAARLLALVRAKRTDDARLRAHRVEDLAGDDSLLGALGVDIGAYEDAVRGY